jgi:hypothetical protein
MSKRLFRYHESLMHQIYSDHKVQIEVSRHPKGHLNLLLVKPAPGLLDEESGVLAGWVTFHREELDNLITALEYARLVLRNQNQEDDPNE